MPFPYIELRQKLVNHLIWLEALDPEYAIWALDQARREPSGVYRDLLVDIKAEKARRASSADTSSAAEKATTTTTSPA